MGASDWTYFVPYQEDINAALQAVRQQVFERGRYYEVDYGDWRMIDEAEMRARLSDEEPEFFDILLEDWRRVKSLSEPDSIERLLAWNGEEGTHTIMDISQGISDERAPGALSPLTDAQMMNAFGTISPSHEQVARWLEVVPLYDFRGRGEGLYIIVYRGDEPTEICFTGFSGD